MKRPRSTQPIPAHAKIVFEGKIFAVYQWEQVLYDGQTSVFEKIKRKDTVGVLGITTDKKVILTEQKQPGTDSFIGLPGGIIEAGESPQETIKRELAEETGYTASKFVLWDAVQPVSKIDWTIYTFIGKNCRKIHGQKFESGENIRIRLVTFEEFLDALVQDHFRDSEVALKILRVLRDKNGITQIRKELLDD